VKRDAWLHRPGCAWAAAGAAAGVLVLAAVLSITAVARRASGGGQEAAPVVTLIPRSSPTEEMVPPSPTVLPTETPQPAATPYSATGRIEVGLVVEVFGTDGDGLRLRSDPGTAGTVQLLAGETEVFVVQDGPVEADGRTWFYLVSPSDASRAGWAVSDYLQLAQ
jgi:hypothetical protein